MDVVTPYDLLKNVDIEKCIAGCWSDQDWDFSLVFTVASNSNRKLGDKTINQTQEVDLTQVVGDAHINVAVFI